jgi:thymidylate kinase
MKPQFIVVEGFDGSGKSSLSNYLSQKYGFKKFKTPYGQFSMAREYFDNKVDPYERITFYSASCISVSLQIREELNLGNSVILDRYTYSTLSYHRAMFGDVPEIIENSLNLILKPDLILYITAEFDTINRRIRERGVSLNDTLFLKKDLFESIDRNYRESFDVPFFCIENNDTFTGLITRTSDLLSNIPRSDLSQVIDKIIH